jgi:hypothetical protein
MTDFGSVACLDLFSNALGLFVGSIDVRGSTESNGSPCCGERDVRTTMQWLGLNE